MNTKSHFVNLLKKIRQSLIPNLGTVLIVAALLFVNNARAAGLNAGTSPSTISYQGTLSTASGAQVNAATGLTFRLYNVQTGGTALWTEAHTGANTVPVANGLFNILLGSITPIPSTVWNNATVYLGVQVAGDAAELSPREMVSSVPMAMMTSNITIPDGSISKIKLSSAIKLQFIQSGSYFGEESTPGWNLSTGSGDRKFVQYISFSEPFQNTPQISINISKFDIDKVDTSRLEVLAENITTNGFNLVIHTWSGTIIWGAGVAWIAYASQ